MSEELTREQFKSLLLDVADRAIQEDYPLMVSSLLDAYDALRAKAQPVWTMNKPTVAGWYWWRYNKHYNPDLAYMRQDPGDGTWSAVKSCCVSFNAYYLDDGEWAGPLPMPKEM